MPRLSGCRSGWPPGSLPSAPAGARPSERTRFSLRSSPLGALAFVVAAGVLLTATADDARAQTTYEVWSATLTVGTESSTIKGYSHGEYGTLSDRHFNIFGADRTILNFSVADDTAANGYHQLQLTMDNNLVTGEYGLVLAGDLKIGATSFTMVTSETPAGNLWFSTGDAVPTDWAENDMIAVSLVSTFPFIRTVEFSDPGTDATYGYHGFSVDDHDVVEVTVTFNEAVTVTGTPQLQLNFDGIPKTANCAAHASDTTKLVCSYTVAENDSAPNGIAIIPIPIGRLSLELNGGTIKAGTVDVLLDLYALAADAAHKVDGVLPTLESAETSADGTEVILTVSEPIGSTGSSPIVFQDGRNLNQVISTSVLGNEVTYGLFSALAHGEVITVQLGRGMVRDVAGNRIGSIDSYSVTNNVPEPPAKITGVAITSDPGSDGIYAPEDTVEATLTFDKAVDVTGTPQITFELVDGGKSLRGAGYVRGTGTTELVFAYTVAATDESDTDGIDIHGQGIVLNGGSITLAGTTDAARLLFPTFTLGAGHRVNWARPTLTSAATSADGASIILTFNEPLSFTPPLRSSFTVKVDGANASLESPGVLPIAGATYTLQPATAVTAGQTVTVSYEDPTTGDDNAALQDRADNDADSFTDQAVTNYVGVDAEWAFTLTDENGNAVTELTEGGATVTAKAEITNSSPFSTNQTVALEWGGTSLSSARIRGAGNEGAITVLAGQISGSLVVSAPELGGPTSYYPPVTQALTATHGMTEIGRVQLTLVDDDPLPVATITDAPATVTEGGDIEIEITLTPAFGVSSVVNFTVTDPDGALSGTPPASVAFSALEKERTVTLTADDNAVQNDARTVTVALQPNADNPYTLGSPSSVTVTVLDDDTVPTAPRTLTASAGNGRVTLEWLPPLSSSTIALDRYQYRQKAGTAAFGSWTDIPDSGPNTRSYTVTGLTNETTYTFKVQARNRAGPGPASNQVEVTPRQFAVPQAPLGMRAYSGAGKVIVRWLARANDGGAVLRYEYCLRTECLGGDGQWVAILDSAAGGANHGRYEIAGVNGSYVHVYLRAVNQHGAGATNNRAAVPFAGAPPAPGNLRAEALSAEFVKISWTEPAAGPGLTIVAYDLERSATGNSWRESSMHPPGTTSQTVRIGENQTIYYRIRTFFRSNTPVLIAGADFSQGFTPPSAVVSVTTVGVEGTLTLPKLGISDAFGHEGRDEALDFDVGLDRPAPAQVTVFYRTRDITARAGSDYRARNGRLVFAPGEKAKVVSVPIIDDTVEDSGEDFALQVFGVSGAVLTRSSGFGTIYNSEDMLSGFTLVDVGSGTDVGVLVAGDQIELADPANGRYGVRAETLPGAEIGSVRLELSGAKTVSRTDEAAPYTLYAAGGEGLPVGAYTLRATAYPEAGLGGVALQTLEVSFRVEAEEPESIALPQVSIASGTSPVAEGAAAAFVLSRTGPVAEALTVTVAVSESGAMLAGTLPTEVTFAAGAATAPLALATEDDAADEADARVTVTVSAPDGYTVVAATATVTVKDDDAAPVVKTASRLAVPENGTAVAALEAEDADTPAADLAWSLAGGADAEAFALTTGGVLSFKAAQDFEAPGDADGNGVYRVTVRVTDGVNAAEAALTVRLTDLDEIAPALAGAAVNGTVLTFTFDEALDGTSAPPAGAFTVTVADAARGVDAVRVADRTVTLTLAEAVAFAETVTAGYTPPAGADAAPLRDAAGNAAAGFTGEAVANETPEPPNAAPTGLPVISGTAQEDETLTASADRIADADGLTGEAFAWQWQWLSNDGAEGAGDEEIEGATKAAYTPAASDVGKTLRVRVTFTDDRGTEETLTSAATVAVAKGLPVVSLGAVAAYAKEGAHALFTLARSGDAEGPLAVALAVSEDGAMLGAPVPAGARFAAGAREVALAVPTAGDGTDEGDSTVTVRVVAGSAYRLAPDAATASVTVLDDDVPVASGTAFDVTLWSADMTVVDYGTGAIGAATAGLFSNVGGSAELKAKWLWYHSRDRTLHLAFTDAIPSEAEEVKLHLGGKAFAAPGGGGDSSFTWHDVDLSWTGGERIAARLAAASQAEDVPDASLRTLAVSGAALSPAFDAEVGLYTARVGTATASVSVSAQASDGSATVAFGPQADADAQRTGHQVAVPVGETLVAVTVSTADGLATREYRVVVERPRAAVSFATGALTATEGEQVAVPVTLSADPGRAVTIPLVAEPGGGAGAEDYAAPASVSFAAGGPLTRTVTLAVASDVEEDPGESVVLGFGELPPGIAAEGTASATVTMVDRPPAPNTPAAEEEPAAATVPAAPGGLAAATGEGRERELTVSWTAPDSDGGSAVTGYKVSWASVSSGRTSSSGTKVLSDPAAVSYTIGGLANGTVWRVRVVAVNAVGHSARVQVTATVQDRTSPELPVVSIGAATSPVTEGTAAAFTLTRTGSPAPALTVAVRVTETGAALSGTPPAAVHFAAGAGSVLLTVATDDDEVAEAASTVTAAVVAGSAHEVDGDAGSAVVTVADDDAAPAVATASPILAPENGTAVAVLAATDADTAVADLTWVTAGGADEERFTLSAAGVLAFAAAPDFEAPDDAGGDGAYEVAVRVSDGANVTESALTVRLLDVDEIAPVLSSTTVDGTVLRLAWSETLDAASQPAAGAFTVTVAAAGRTVTGVAVSGSAVTLTLASAVAADETVAVGYAVPADAEAARVRDAAGNAAAGFAGQAVTNTTGAPNAAPTGLPEISGTAQVGQTLTASRGDIEDADGLIGATFTYQWLSSDGTTDAEIAGAKESSYELAAADAGKTIKVRVTFTDDRGTEGTLTSAATAAVGTPATGRPLISGTLREGETLTASRGDIEDADGLSGAEFTWQWVWLGPHGFQDIEGATGKSHTLRDGDAGTYVRVWAIFTDDRGHAERRRSLTTTEAVTVRLLDVDEIAPVLSSAAVDGTVLTLAWSETLDASEPAAGAFTVTVGTAGRTVTGVAVRGSAVTLTLASAVAADDTVTVGYTLPADADAARIKDAAGNAAAGFTGQAVTNETAAAPAAELSVGDAAAQAGQFQMRIAFAEAVTGLAVEDLGAERVGGAAAAVSQLTEAQTGRVWTATVAAAEAGRYLVRLAAGAAQAGARQSLGAVLAVDVDAQGNAVAVAGPVVTSVALATAADASRTAGDTVQVTFAFSEPVTVDTAAGTPSVGIALDGDARSASYASGTGTASLAFAYAVTAEDGSVAAVAVTADSLVLNDGTIRDAAGRDADLTHAGIGTVASEAAAEEPEPAAEEPPAEEPEPAADPNALTASFLELPAAHGGPGSGWFVFELRLSEEIAISFRTMRDHSLAVTGGTVTGARRLARPSNMRWAITVKPSVWGDMTVTLAHGRACDETGAICTAAGKALSATATATIPGPLTLTVADARVAEGADAELAFAVSLNRAPAWPVLVNYATADGTATAGADYTAASGMLSFAPGETEKTIEVAVLDDAHDEGEETLTLELSNASGARIRDAAATGTIVNSDPLPRAWLARFGRTAAGHVLDAVGERLAGTRRDTQVTVAGRRLSAATAADTPAYHDPLQRREEPRTMQLAELVGGSSFHLLASAGTGADALADGSGAGADDGGRWTVWGRGGWTRFAGTEDRLSLDGEVITGTVGADYEQDRLLAGLAVAHSVGDGTFEHASGRSGDMRTTLTSVHPYVRLTLHERLAVWGLFGYALRGDLELDESGSAEAIETGAGMLMGAFGARGTLLAAAPGGGFELAAEADGLVLRMRSEKADGLVATTAQVERLRLTLQGSYRGLPLLGGVLTPALEVGGRYDGGDAETGAGLVVGGSLRYAVPAWGLTLAGSGQGLLLHETGGFSEWGAGGSLRLDPGTPDRGVALSVAPSWGTTATTAATLWSLPDAARLAAQGPAQPQPGARLDAELSYGLDAPGANGALTPYAAVALADGGARTARLGSRLSLDSGLTLSLEATRSEHAVNAPQHTFALSGALRY